MRRLPAIWAMRSLGASKRREGGERQMATEAIIKAESQGTDLRKYIPFWEKSYLTIDEAAAYTGIGKHKLRELTDNDNCSFVLWVGSKRLIKRRLLDQFLDNMYSI